LAAALVLLPACAPRPPATRPTTTTRPPAPAPAPTATTSTTSAPRSTTTIRSTTTRPATTSTARAIGAGTPLRDHLAFGAYVPDLPGGRAGVAALEARLGAPLQVLSAFTDWSYVFGNADDRWMAAGGTRRVLYSWEPVGVRLAAVANGSQDAYLQRVADSMRAYPYDIYVRPWGEMNANWSSWQPTPAGEKRDGGTPAELVAAWRHTVTFFRSRGVTNLKFVFNPDASDFADNTRIDSIWPGAGYVDVLGIDGYNWGHNPATGDTWREFDAIFGPMYAILTRLHPTAPVWIAEVGSKEPATDDGAPADPARDKGAWLTRMMTSTAFPRVEAMAWFSTRKERDWRIDSSPGALAALRTQLAARR
jgi:hypothetical protein